MADDSVMPNVRDWTVDGKPGLLIDNLASERQVNTLAWLPPGMVTPRGMRDQTLELNLAQVRHLHAATGELLKRYGRKGGR